MSWSSASKWFQRSVGFVLPIAANPVPVDNLFQAGPLATRFPQINWGATRGGVAAAGLLWYDIGGPQRTYDVLFQRGTSGEHWQNTPKQQFERRKTHGFVVSPSDRMRRNPEMRTSIHVAQRDWAREGIAWMP
jgi:hypothetical protein